jgi:hypothetical protein
METMRPNKVTVDENMLDHLVAFCREEQRTRLLLLADRNTWAVQGESVHAALAAAGCDVKTLIFQRSEVVADARTCLSNADCAGQQRAHIAGGWFRYNHRHHALCRAPHTRSIHLHPHRAIGGCLCFGRRTDDRQRCQSHLHHHVADWRLCRHSHVDGRTAPNDRRRLWRCDGQVHLGG